MQRTNISWTDYVWNPVTGCTKISPGCTFCYAETLAQRHKWTPEKWTQTHEDVNIILNHDRLQQPLTTYKTKPGRVFVNSVSDLFHRAIPDDFIRAVFQTMTEAHWHTYQILTKRPERVATWPGPWPANVWVGTSIENDAYCSRADELRQCGAAVKFLSIEPLLGPVPRLDVTGIDWVIVGGESGTHLSKYPERRMRHEWAVPIKDACVAKNVAFFFKQSSDPRPGKNGMLQHADGSLWQWHQWPDDRRVPVCITPAP